MLTGNIPQVSIIILNWNGWKDTLECLESVYQNHYPHYEVIVVDNASTDDSLSRIREYCEGEIVVESPLLEYNPENKPIHFLEYGREDLRSLEQDSQDFSPGRLTLIKNDENEGFARANNMALDYARHRLNTDYLFLLNNDTVMDKESITRLIKLGESQKEVGALCSTVYDYGEGRFNMIQSQGVCLISGNIQDTSPKIRV